MVLKHKGVSHSLPEWNLPGNILIHDHQHHIFSRLIFRPFPALHFPAQTYSVPPTGKHFRNPHLLHSGKFLCGNTRGLWAEMVEETVVKPMSWVHTSQLQQSQVSHNYHLYLLTYKILKHQILNRKTKGSRLWPNNRHYVSVALPTLLHHKGPSSHPSCFSSL